MTATPSARDMAEAIQRSGRTGFAATFSASVLDQMQRRLLSDKQMAVLTRLWTEVTTPPPATVALAGPGIDGVRDLFARATANGLKRPAITVTVDEVELHLARAPDHGRNPGAIYITDPTKTDQFGRPLYLGSIAKGGDFQPRRECTADYAEALATFAENPATVAAASGRLTGRCSFCRLPLSDARSTAVGYGAHCARKWGLAWGDSQDGSKPRRTRTAKAPAALAA